MLHVYIQMPTGGDSPSIACMGHETPLGMFAGPYICYVCVMSQVHILMSQAGQQTFKKPIGRYCHEHHGMHHGAVGGLHVNQSRGEC